MIRFIKIPHKDYYPNKKMKASYGTPWWINPAPPIEHLGGCWLINFYCKIYSTTYHIYNVDLGRNKRIKPYVLFEAFGYLVVINS